MQTNVAVTDLKDVLDHLLVKLHFPAMGTGIQHALLLFAIGGALLTGVAVYVMIAVWIERKVCAHIQDRLGPMRVGWHGILQSIIDPIKLGLKEDLVPDAADRILFLLAPFVILCSAFATFVVIPFQHNFVMADLNIGVLYVVSVGSGVLMGSVMAGWASNNKWALFGAMRTVAMVVSYEIPIGLCIIPIVMLTGSLSMQDIVMAQQPPDPATIGFLHRGMFSWFMFKKIPLLFSAFLILYTAALAECNRTPFDLAEAESELVAGYHTEYSGIRWSFFFLAEYADMLVLSCMGAVLFMGGWWPLQIWNFRTPDPYFFWSCTAVSFAYLYWLWTRWYIPMKEYALIAVQAVLVFMFFVMIYVLPELTWFLTKSLLLVFLMIWLRWTLPRLRIDQLMYLCWKVLIPLSLINFLGVGIWMVFGAKLALLATVACLIGVGLWAGAN